jgi:non-canonical purine NTP pyrophosphatase (RdgB/HAM1 family)
MPVALSLLTQANKYTTYIHTIKQIFEGRTPGKIVPARGPHNFGWDPIFQPDGFEETYAELDKDIKNTISHRYRALAKLRDYLMESGKDGDEKAKEA